MGRVIVWSVSICLSFCAHFSAAVFEVGPDKPYQTIWEAVRAASAGDTVLVDPGLYVEAGLSLKEGLTLAAAGGGRTVIAYHPKMSYGYILWCNDGCVVSGFWLVGAPDYAIASSGRPGFRLHNCVIWGNNGVIAGYYPGWHCAITNCTVFGNEEGIVCEGGSTASLRNTIMWGNTSNLAGDISASYCDIEGGWPGEGNINADAMFVDPQQPDFWALVSVPSVDPIRGNLRLRQGSPCIDVGANKAANVLETDIAGNPRVMFGGKSLAVDIGAYEYYPCQLRTGPDGNQSILTWSSLADKTYSIFYTDDLFNWHIAIDNFPSSGNQTTSWADDGSLTGLPPLLAPKRFYRLLENP